MYVTNKQSVNTHTERLLKIKVMIFLGFLWFASDFCTKRCDWFEKL